MDARQERFFDQLKSHRGYIVNLLTKTSRKEAEVIPPGFRNNIRWNAGHVYTEQYMWLKELTKEDVDVPEAFDKWFGWGSSPENFTDETPALDELIDLLRGQIDEIKAGFGGRLDETFAPTDNWGFETIEQVLTYTLFHEGMHIQAILDIKKVMKTASQNQA